MSDNIAQLFHTLDPFPFRERDLDKEVEEFIVGWARELTTDGAITIVVHLPEASAQTKAAQELGKPCRDTSPITPTPFNVKSTGI